MASSLSLSAASCWWKLMRGMTSPPGDGIIRALYCDATVKQPCEYAATGGSREDTRARCAHRSGNRVALLNDPITRGRVEQCGIGLAGMNVFQLEDRESVIGGDRAEPQC